MKNTSRALALLALSLTILCSPNSRSAQAAQIEITEQNIGLYLYIGTSLRLACQTDTGQLGRLSKKRLVVGAKFFPVALKRLLGPLSKTLRDIKTNLRRASLEPQERRALRKALAKTRLTKRRLLVSFESCRSQVKSSSSSSSAQVASSLSSSESSLSPVLHDCSDDIDNDGDGLIDWIYDLGCTGPHDSETAGPREQKDGWTTYDPHPDTQIIFVSASLGNNTWSGFLPEPNAAQTDGPVKSVKAGYTKLRNQFPDWLLFRRGDEWTDEALIRDNTVPPYSTWPTTSGRSEQERIVIGSYGPSTQRPKFNFSNATWLFPAGNVDAPKHVSIIGLHLYAYTKDPANPKFNAQSGSAIQWLSQGGDFLLEDCRIEFAQVNLQGSPTLPLTLRRNILSGNYSVGSHAQSIFTSIQALLTLEENLLNHGGWSDDFRLVLLHPVGSLPAWTAVTNGRFRIELAEMLYNVSGMDFSPASDMNAVAAIMQQRINQAAGVPDLVQVHWTEGNVFKIHSVLESDDGYSISRWRLKEIGVYRVSWGQSAATSKTLGTELSLTAEKALPTAVSLSLRPDDTTIASWQSLDDAQFDVTVNGTKYSVSGLNLSTADSMAAIASAMQQAINQTIESSTGTPNVVSLTWDGSRFLFVSTVSQNDKQEVTDISDIVQYPDSSVPGSDLEGPSWLDAVSSGGQGVPESTVFNRNMYLSHGYGNTIVRGNIDANGASGGVQQRMGGVNEDNLFLRNPHAVIFGSSENNPENVSGVIRNNVVLGARNIDTQVQGSGIVITSSSTTTYGGASLIEDLEVYGNIIAHNELGTGNFKGIALFGTGVFLNTEVHDNIIYNWSRPDWPNPNDHRAVGFSLAVNSNSTDTSFHHNIVQQPHSGFVGSSGNSGAGISLFNNIYYSAEADPPQIWSKGWFEIGSSVSWDTWMSQTAETGAVRTQIKFVDPDRTIETYMLSLGETPTYEAFIERAKQQSKLNWDSRFTAYAVNAYVRQGFTVQK